MNNSSLDDENNEPKNIILLKEITTKAYSDWIFENNFIVYNSFYQDLILVYTNESNSIVFYDLNKSIIIIKINNPHKECITNYNQIYSQNLKSDLVMSISKNDNNLKVWETKNMNCLVDLQNVNQSGLLNSATFLLYNNDIYILTSNRNWINPECIKVFDFTETKKREIYKSNYNTFVIDTFYDKKNLKTYIITGNEGSIISYDYEDNNKYHEYFLQDEKKIFHHSIIVYDDNDMTKLIESSDGSGYIRIWDFHSGTLLNQIKLSILAVKAISLWNNSFLFVGCGDKTIKILNLDNNKIIDSLIGHSNSICCIKVIKHPIFGKCLISQGH